MLKEVARLNNVPVSVIREQFENAIWEMQNSDDPDQRAKFQEMFGERTPTPEEYICATSKQLKF
ncbi:TPA: hypothetical protein ACSVR1_003616 [Clostridioides difficile]|uniref:hypothetical protein n=1 Tax=Clostridioides difficile TaxID=1496 RepID=UPI0010B85F9B|nr:hypothetical protein [Clostridioides difficile]VHY63985.1 conjugative transposon protein [Clostridioides difficile]VHY66712.1 conjugative transposon protein [Clostridioides difficile]